MLKFISGTELRNNTEEASFDIPGASTEPDKWANPDVRACSVYLVLEQVEIDIIRS